MPAPVLKRPRKPHGVFHGEGVILGVDTHKDVHVGAVLTMAGVLLATHSFATTSAGYQALLLWAYRFGEVSAAGIECTGSYGSALMKYLHTQHVLVFEVNQPDRALRRKAGKTDAVDAEAAGRAVLAGRSLSTPKDGIGGSENLRQMRLVKSSAVKARTTAINQLKGLVVGAEPGLRDELRGLTTKALTRACAVMLPTSVERMLMAELAHRISSLTDELTRLKTVMTQTVTACVPELLQRSGIGYDSAAALIIAVGDNPERMTNEASFAALCGVSPVEFSSGQTTKRRLNRGGNRQANAALYRIVLTRLRWDPRTQEYLKNRTEKGKSKRDVIRCLKCYIAREIFTIIKTIRDQPKHLTRADLTP
ncbi:MULTISPECIES: IS110 family transposase [unclassified Cryobacterium]|uniref:IS110 family transposase n=1 Tax=unclassified Cryobacterium TaxID=2649013 RepID=UPI00106D0EC5|nr:MULTISPECIES: IS110 family transposase [unclassified Cryobacterium]TFD05850.1 IS110 family transposase [Cryobacterium sp. TMT1-66-1]TFD09941.1 IS110 family transposase [Cryobacterium sp. TMT1-2-2]